MTDLQALIFDVDGTLAETEEAHRQAFNDTFKAHGLDWQWDRSLYKALLSVTGGRERMRHYIDHYRPGTGADLSNDEIAALHADKTRRYGAIVAAGAISLRPGVARLLREARETGLRLAIATTTSMTNVTTLLASTLGNEAETWFDVTGAAEQASSKKPAPDVYHWVLERLGLPVSACLAIEDSYNGLQAASTAGLTTLITPSLYTRDEDFSVAASIVPDLSSVTLTTLSALLESRTE